MPANGAGDAIKTGLVLCGRNVVRVMRVNSYASDDTILHILYPHLRRQLLNSERMQNRWQTGQRMARRQPALSRPVHRQHLARFAHRCCAAQRDRLACRTVERALNDQLIAGQHAGNRLNSTIFSIRTVHVPVGRNGGHVFGAAHLTQTNLGSNVSRLRQNSKNRYARSRQGRPRTIGDTVSFGDDALMARRNNVTPFRVDTWW